MIPDEDRPVCDFCDLMIEEDEELEPVFVGEPPTPKPLILRAMGDKRRSNRYKAKYDALRRALHDSAEVELNESDAVYTIDSGQQTQFTTQDELIENGITGYEYQESIDHDKVGVSIAIQRERDTRRPSAEVCPNCAEMFRGIGD